MSRQQDRLTLLDQRSEGSAKLPGTNRIDSRRRLVEEEDIGVVHQRAGDVQPLPHATGICLHMVSLPASQADQFDELRDPDPLHPRRDAIELGEVTQVVDGGEPVVETAVAAEGVADALAHVAGVAHHVEAEHRALPAVGSSKVISILMVVVLPGPSLGPSRPKSSPRSIENVIPQTALRPLACAARRLPCAT